jgi:serine/threonine protein kinase
MGTSTGLGDLKTSEWQELQQIADRFEKAWRKVADQGEPPDLARFLPPPQDPLRKVVLQELIKTDLEARWRRNLSTGIEFYLQRFSELGGAKELPASLLYEEYRIRHSYGDKPPVTAYQRRFPDQFSKFEKLVGDEPMATNLVTITAPPPTPDTLKAPPATGSTAPVMASAGRKIGDYDLVDRLGSGSFGEVWRALAPGGVPCAVKVLTRSVDHETAKRELESLELIKSIRHPFLLQTQQFKVFEERLYIVMELADGSLRSRLKECRKEGHNGIPLEELIPYFHESAEALDFLHSKKIQHRDVKPDNILLLERHVKVADFGLARLQGERSLMTATSSGTPAYMGPEVWSGKFSEHSDQYALAFTYAELRLDRRVFPGVSLPEMMTDHLTSTPDLSPMPEAEKEVVLRAMAKDPAKRFPSCKEFAQALDLATRKERGVSMPAHEGGAVSEAPTADNSQGGTDPWSTMGSPLPVTLQDQQSAAGRTVPWKPPTVSKWPLFAGMAVALMAIIAMGIYSLKHPKGAGGAETPSFILSMPADVPIAQGKAGTFSIPVTRKNFNKPIKLTFENCPKNVTLEPGDSGDGDELGVKVSVDAEARPGNYEITVHPEGDDKVNDKTLKLSVLFLPEGFEPADAKDVVADNSEKKYYSRIVRQFEPNMKMEFVCIARLLNEFPDGTADPGTYYISIDKVSVAMFRKFAEEVKLSNDWTKSSIAKVAVNEFNKPMLPVMNVTVTEAYQFARKMFGERCNLPKKVQWDKAAGYYAEPRPEGPFHGHWDENTPLKIAVSPKLDQPLNIGESKDDESLYHCRDMSGNGREWTRNVQTVPASFVPLENPGGNEPVIIRGKSFLDKEPFLFEMDIKEGQSANYSKRLSDVGFRVVIDP